MRKYIRYIVLAGIAVYCLFVIQLISRDKVNSQKDLQVYYYTSKAYLAGLNPYTTDAVAQMNPSIDTTRLPYPYLPSAVFLFMPLTFLSYEKMFYLFLVIQSLFLAALIFVWARAFLKKEADTLFYFFCLLGFNSAICLGIANGNIVILEQLLIWMSFLFFVRKRLFLFCLVIIIAASFKLMPVVFLSLLLFAEDEDRHIYLLTAVIVFCGIQALSFAVVRDSFECFTKNGFGRLDEVGLLNPSTLVFFAQLHQLALAAKGIDLSSGIPWVCYIAAAGVVIFVTCKVLARLKRSCLPDKYMVAVFFACVAYALVVPRMKDYSYTLLIVPAYYIFRRMSGIKPYILLFILAVLTVRTQSLPFINLGFLIVYNYNPLIIAYSLWGFYIYYINDAIRKPMAQ